MPAVWGAAGMAAWAAFVRNLPAQLGAAAATLVVALRGLRPLPVSSVVANQSRANSEIVPS